MENNNHYKRSFYFFASAQPSKGKWTIASSEWVDND